MVKRQPDAEGLDEGTTADDMYLIRFEGDALEITAWGHEVCQLIRAIAPDSFDFLCNCGIVQYLSNTTGSKPMSTHIVDRIEAIRLSKEVTGQYEDIFLVAELGGDNNVTDHAAAVRGTGA